jgi:membrane protein involved in colicin uptake
MFTTSRDADLAAIQQMEAEGLHHYDAHCPKCRRANAIDRIRLEKIYPNWRKDLDARKKDAQKTAVPKTAAPKAVVPKAAAPKTAAPKAAASKAAAPKKAAPKKAAQKAK